MIHTDRSRVECRDKCDRKRFFAYEYQGRGLEKKDALKLDARIGSWCHLGIEAGLNQAGVRLKAEASGAGFMLECFTIVDEATAAPQQRHDIIEGSQIVTALVYAWLRTVAPRLLSDGDVLAIEKELTVDFQVGSETVRLMARPDVIWRRRGDGSILIRNIKTVRKADDRFREKWALDQQTLSEPLAVDAWLTGQTKEPFDVYDNSCGGVIIDGLVTGEVLYDKYRQLYYHNNPLIYAWMSGDIGVAEKPEFYPRYEWSCTAPHKFSNGRRCEGGRTHKLSGVRKVSVADHYPGGIIAWIDYLIAEHQDVVAECIVELPPVMRSDYHIERWKRQVLHREVQIHHDAEYVQDERVPDHFDERLDLTFPMNTSNGNCLYPGRCDFYDCCWGVAGADPLGSGLFQIRTPNHPQEKEK